MNFSSNRKKMVRAAVVLTAVLMSAVFGASAFIAAHGASAIDYTGKGYGYSAVLYDNSNGLRRRDQELLRNTI